MAGGIGAGLPAHVERLTLAVLDDGHHAGLTSETTSCLRRQRGTVLELAPPVAVVRKHF
jgi:hypothetical protein